MTPQQFIAKWQSVQLSERSACQQHFLDLCDLLGQPKPAEVDREGTWYTFERGVQKTEGGQGWADVWLKDKFGWEYKGKHKNLDAAYAQLLQYREALENPPLLVVCDLDRFKVHTNFTRSVKRVYEFALDGLAEPENLDILRKAFTDPDALRPGQTAESVTRQVAESFGQLSDGLRQRGIEPHRGAHFLMKLMFCMFAEDIGLLPKELFTRLLTNAKDDPQRLAKLMQSLFTAMSEGGDFGAEVILYFDGGLFADADVIELQTGEIATLIDCNAHDWGDVEPSIFGTLFERTLDPAKRSQIGAHYTSREDILTLLEPVMMAPLRREWDEVQVECDKLWGKVQSKSATSATKRSNQKKLERKLLDFVERLAHVRVLDPACGSGNFLYVSINLLLDLNKQVITYGSTRGVGLLPQIRPTQLAGIEINPYAQQLAQVVIWIGYLQWMHDNGFPAPRDPVLEPIETIELKDAILDLSDPENPKEPEWPEADFIVGNPPFLGGKLLRTNMGDEYIDALFRLWNDRVPREADICCYWFEKGRKAIERKRVGRVGLLATQGIRGGANRRVVQRIKDSGDIFFAESDRNWILDGAAVHVSMIGYDDAVETTRVLDGKPVEQINSNLTGTVDLTSAKRFACLQNVCFMADTKGGAFDIEETLALQLLNAPNPHARPNSDIIVPWVNGLDVTRRPRDMWIIDFGVETPVEVAALYEQPFRHVEENVKPLRDQNKRRSYREKWWIHVEPRPAMRVQIERLPRFLTTISVGKYRLFRWMERPTLPDHQLFAFSHDDDYFFGVLHSSIHELWARGHGTQVRERESGFRYTPTTCFETFPFPEPTDAQRGEIAAAAKELDTLRNNWLNPPEWVREEVLEFPGSVGGPWRRYIVAEMTTDKSQMTNNSQIPNSKSEIGLVRYPRLVPKDDECARRLKKRTLTNLYNERPTWLDLAHKRLDAAVFAAYGWDAGDDDAALLARLLELNLQRAEAEGRKPSGK